MKRLYMQRVVRLLAQSLQACSLARVHRKMAALQMKYRPSNVDGQPDAETAAILQVLNQAR